MSFQPGERVGDYEILATLGAGGMGQVYKVRNLISDRIEAMKVLLPNLEADPGLADRFLREIKVQASLNHPNIAQLYSAVRVNNQLLMLMEFVEGWTLEQMLEHGPVPLERGVDAICQVAGALSFAHARGVIHRDIKPANMMMTPGGVVKLMDFGIARATAEHKLTQTGQTVGSLYYMSPEQIRGEQLDPRADLYSLGISLYEVVTGQRPFRGDSEFSIMAAHLQQVPAPPIELDPRLPPALNEIILTTISKDAAQRFQSAEALRNALAGVLEEMRQGPKKAAPVVGQPVAPQQAQAAVAPPIPVVAPAPAAAAVVAASAKPGGHRGLYMAIGSLVTLGVLVVAVTQIPKWIRASAASGHAQPQGVMQPVTGQAGAGQVQPTAAAPQQPQPQPENPPAASLPATPTGAAPTATSVPERRTAHQASQAQEPPRQQPVETLAPAEPPPARPAAPSQEKPAATAAAIPAVPQANQAELRGVRERLMLLATRGGAVRGTIANIEREQARQGLGMRLDIKTAEGNFTFFMDEAEADLKNGDTASAKASLDKAEMALERLETFVGRR